MRLALHLAVGLALHLAVFEFNTFFHLKTGEGGQVVLAAPIRALPVAQVLAGQAAPSFRVEGQRVGAALAGPRVEALEGLAPRSKEASPWPTSSSLSSFCSVF